jgi:hypothetical protein
MWATAARCAHSIPDQEPIAPASRTRRTMRVVRSDDEDQSDVDGVREFV